MDFRDRCPIGKQAHTISTLNAMAIGRGRWLRLESRFLVGVLIMKMPDGKTFDTDQELVNERRFHFGRKRRNYWATRNPDEFIPCSRVEPFSYLVECRLILAAQGGNTVARNQVWEHYARVVLSVANELYIPQHLLEDAIQEGLIGLYRAIIAFDVASLDTFSEFSRVYIRRQIQRFLFAFSFRAKIPSNWFYEYCRFANGLHKCVNPIVRVIIDNRKGKQVLL